MGHRTKVLIVDDHQIVRMGLATIIGNEKDMVVVGEARNGIEALQKTLELKPDIVLMDLMMPKRNGVSATADIAKAAPGAKVVLLTTFGSSADVGKAMAAGAAGALVKDTPSTELVAALRRVSAGERVLSREIEKNLVEMESESCLSERQRMILGCIAKGFSNKEIASILRITTDGVSAHLRTVFEKLGASTRAEAVSIAMRRGILEIA